MHTLSFSRFPPPAFLRLHLCQQQGWQRPLGLKVSSAASGGETTPALLSYLWFCFCIVTLIWWQRSDCLTNEFPCPAVLRTVWWELDRSVYELTAAQMWRLPVQMKHSYQPTKVFVPLVSWGFKGKWFLNLQLHTEVQFVFKYNMYTMVKHGALTLWWWTQSVNHVICNLRLVENRPS